MYCTVAARATLRGALLFSYTITAIGLENVTSNFLAAKNWCSMLGCQVAEAENAYVLSSLLQFWLLFQHPVRLLPL